MSGVLLSSLYLRFSDLDAGIFASMSTTEGDAVSWLLHTDVLGDPGDVPAGLSCGTVSGSSILRDFPAGSFGASVLLGPGAPFEVMNKAAGFLFCWYFKPALEADSLECDPPVCLELVVEGCFFVTDVAAGAAWLWSTESLLIVDFRRGAAKDQALNFVGAT